MNYRMIFYILGWVLNIEAAAMLLPLICAVIYGDGTVASLVYSILICLVIGVPLTFRAPEKKTMFAKEGFITVALSWITLSIFGCLPFFISRYIPNFFDALFETVSGFSTTGASILTDVEALPKSLLFWRSFTHWLGGMGVLVFLVSILQLSGGQNLHLIRAESTGAVVSKIVPKVKNTAGILYTIYLCMTVLLIIFLLCGKMPLFDALTTAFGTAGTGGFGIKNDSMASYSPFIQNTVTVFMILFGVNFSLYYLLLCGKIKSALKSEELRTYIGIIIVAITIIAFNCHHLFGSIGETIRHSAFQVGSIITTTGFMSNDFDKWPELSKTVLVLLMFIGACAGSTGGGIKVSRILVLFKSIAKEIKLAAQPGLTKKIISDGRLVEHETVRSINVFIASYLVILVVSVLLISVDNFDFTTNVTAVISAINNIGPGLGGVGPTQNFSAYSSFSKVILSLNMLIGRLEIFPMLILFSPFTWKK
ncbi:MAG: TrkH family potassium uptake protein [Clostridia bacterium]|nr:TrkH family potassium uptake protein [Clostridia bacterium]